MSLIASSHFVLINTVNTDSITRLYKVHYDYLHLREYVAKINPVTVWLSVQSPSIFEASLLASLDAGKEVSGSAGFAQGFPDLILDLSVETAGCCEPEVGIHRENGLWVMRTGKRMGRIWGQDTECIALNQRHVTLCSGMRFCEA